MQSNSKIIHLVTFLMLGLCTLAKGATGEWWLDTLGTQLTTFDELKEVLQVTDADKIVVLDLYMQDCYWCQKFQAEWNQIVNEFTDAYEGKVVFYKVDGPHSHAIASFVQANGYPAFYKFQPSSNGSGQQFNDQRSYDAMKKWLIKAAEEAGFVPRAGGPITAAAPVIKQQTVTAQTSKGDVSSQITQLLTQLQQVVGSNSEEITKLRTQTQVLVDYVAETKEAQLAHPTSDFNSMVYFMIGIISGAIVSMVFVTYLVKLGKFAKKPKSRAGQKHSAGSNKSTEVDECDEDKFV